MKMDFTIIFWGVSCLNVSIIQDTGARRSCFGALGTRQPLRPYRRGIQEDTMNQDESNGFVWKWCVPRKTQWFCWSLSLLNGYFIGNIPYFQTYPNQLFQKKSLGEKKTKFGIEYHGVIERFHWDFSTFFGHVTPHCWRAKSPTLAPTPRHIWTCGSPHSSAPLRGHRCMRQQWTKCCVIDFLTHMPMPYTYHDWGWFIHAKNPITLILNIP